MKPIKEYINEALIGRQMSGREITWSKKEIKEQVGGEILKWLGLDTAKYMRYVKYVSKTEVRIDFSKMFGPAVTGIYIKERRPDLPETYKFSIDGDSGLAIDLTLDLRGGILKEDSEYLNEAFKNMYFSSITYGAGVTSIEGLDLAMCLSSWSGSSYNSIFGPADGRHVGQTRIPDIIGCKVRAELIPRTCKPMIGPLLSGHGLEIYINRRDSWRWIGLAKEISFWDDDLTWTALRAAAGSIEPEEFEKLAEMDGHAIITCPLSDELLKMMDKDFQCPWIKGSWKVVSWATVYMRPISKTNMPKVSVVFANSPEGGEIRTYMSKEEYYTYRK